MPTLSIASLDTTALILVAATTGHPARRLGRVLSERGARVVWASEPEQARELATALQPDCILIESGLRGRSGGSIAWSLLSEARIEMSTPILIIADGAPSPGDRLEAIKGGARACLDGGMNDDEMHDSVQAYVHVKHEADALLADRLMDPRSGLYNLRGLARRINELAASAVRHHFPLACVALTVELDPGATEAAARLALTRCAPALQQVGRRSDSIGRIGPTEFVVVAPDTDHKGALQLARRLSEALKTAANGAGLAPHAVRISGGYDAVDDLAYAPTEAPIILTRAMSAVRAGSPDPGNPWLNRSAS
ncbi:MAG TPA: diguanylate cyclase [Gemmatimonadales bacterium]|jgi:PleD family two-component response regulator|nr:diguanylate cyclase [Gemmatimonadales bacterium]